MATMTSYALLVKGFLSSIHVPLTERREWCMNFRHYFLRTTNILPEEVEALSLADRFLIDNPLCQKVDWKTQGF